MANYYDQWSVNPAENNAAPPLGAGEFKLTFDQISDTFRVIMAAIKQLANVVGAFGSMASQNSDNVNISGGTIGTNVSIAAEALKSGLIDLARIPATLTGKVADGLTLAARQQLYNWINPVGIIKLWHTYDMNGSGLIWPGLTAAWQIVPGSNDRIITSAGGLSTPGAGAGSMNLAVTMGTSNGGAHTPVIQGHVLTNAELPTNDMIDADFTLTGGSLGFAVGTRSYVKTFGGGQAHSHGANAVPDHAHNVTYDPLRYGVIIVQRMS